MRRTLKRLAEAVLLHGGPARASRSRLAGRGLVLAYHNVVPDDCEVAGEASLHLPLSQFREQISALADLADVVPIPVLLDPGAPGRISSRRPLVAITFDDAYLGAVELALPELSARGMPATLFVSPGRLGGQSFWWDRYAGEIGSNGVSDLRAAALELHDGRENLVTGWAARSGWLDEDLPAPARTASEDALSAAARLKGVTLGSHAWSHPNLTKLDGRDLRTELERPLKWLTSRFESARAWISYPYGLADARVAASAAESGYQMGFRIDGGWLAERGENPLMLPRLNVPAGISDTGFRCRLSGLLCRR